MMNADNLVGNTLSDRYEVIEKVGTGGMASVFKAKDKLLNRLVAIKVLKQDSDDEKMSNSFIKEAQSAASLTHNNIVSVYDVGEEDGIKYMVMELVDGITLKEYIKKMGTLPWQEACDFALQIGQGIGFAHESSIIHRDIKPQNIIMTKDKTLKVTDFGIARVAASDTTIVGGTALGSVHYISPEQARGSHTDERSDIYSLGIVLYEMLAGRVPFDGETPVTIALMHLEKEPVNVRCINMDIPKALAYVTMKAISKSPSDRYKNIEQFLEDIHAVLAEEPLPSADGMEEEEVIVENDYEDDYVEYFDDEDDYQEEEKVIRKKDKKTEKKVNKKKRPPKTAKQKREDRNAVLLAFLTLIIMAVVAVGAYSLFGLTKGTKTPDLVNMTVEEARAMVESLDKGIKIDDEIEYTISDEVEEGRVVSHTPEKGEFIAKGDKIKLVLSIGASGGNMEVPDVVGEDFNKAIGKILEKELTYVVVEEESKNTPAGRVIRQLPVAGTMLNRDDIVTLYVSKAGSKTTQSPEVVKKATVPNLVGMGKDDAIIAIEAAGLVVTSVNKQYSDSLEGLVIAQSPEYPTTVDAGSGVSIIVSKGPRVEEEPSPEPETTTTSTPETEPSVEEQPSVQTPEPENTPQSPEAAVTEKTKQFTVKIPESSGQTVSIEIRANDVVVHSAEHNKTEGYVTVDIPGTSGDVSVQAWIDGSLAAQRTLNFD